MADVVSFDSAGQPGLGEGSIADNAYDTVTYTPAPGFHGTPHFDVTVEPMGGLQTTATLTVWSTPLP